MGSLHMKSLFPGERNQRRFCQHYPKILKTESDKKLYQRRSTRAVPRAGGVVFIPLDDLL